MKNVDMIFQTISLSTFINWSMNKFLYDSKFPSLLQLVWTRNYSWFNGGRSHGSWQCHFQEYDTIRKFPRKCNYCEQEPKANRTIKYASMKKTCQKRCEKCDYNFTSNFIVNIHHWYMLISASLMRARRLDSIEPAMLISSLTTSK